ncbi:MULTISPECIES: DUF3466 family protein [unclassified Pseudoalteromonas]|uniref:DUF3466 family protein n=1 Tax=unclassified Pseudoalteromonas TaxID=194690 RepID=UPI0020968CA6|nr:DUF3466 family protein [Pseudoalteromonas sp. XMcav2-N]MCO7187967.1 DUF3466 family protein [Pseudoalteromonas sp. XMcav2-N]
MKYSLMAASIIFGLSGQAIAAPYKLTELPTSDIGKMHYVSDVNESGDAIGRVTGLYNLPVDISYIDFSDTSFIEYYELYKEQSVKKGETIEFTLDDIENGDALSTDADAHTFMLSYLSSNTQSASAEFQKISSVAGLEFTGTTTNLIDIFDVESPDYAGLTRSVSNAMTAIAADGTVVAWGSAPFKKITFTPDGESEAKTYFVRDWHARGIVISPGGKRVTLEPPFTEYGGYSIANDITLTDEGNYLIVGQASVGLPENSQTTITDNCDDKDEPEAVCIWRQGRGVYDLRAYQWTLDKDFNVIDTKDLGIGLERKDDENNPFYSSAFAINKAGIAVGKSRVRIDDSLKAFEEPGYYQDGQFFTLREHDDIYQAGFAVDINDSNVIAGYVGRQNQGTLFDVTGYYYDMNDKKFVELPTYFNGSDTVVRDINNTGYMVGEGEVEKNVTSPRYEGFMYKIGDENLTNINDLLPCKSDDFPYTVSEAIRITDDNTIYAIATKTVGKLDSLGKPDKDANGNDASESIVVSVVLTQTGSTELEQCAEPEAETYERQSASLSWLSMLALPLAWTRRRRRR